MQPSGTHTGPLTCGWILTRTGPRIGGPDSTNNGPGASVTSAAGGRLAVLARSTANQANAAGYGYQVHPISANDFEAFGMGSAHATASRAWMNGYNGTSGAQLFVNYGSADGCPISSVPGANSCNVGLNAESIFHVSYTGVAWPLPEIYTETGSQAAQWRYLSRYAKANHGTQFHFQGVMAQHGACSQVGGCAGTNNGPGDAWNQLRGQVDSDPNLPGTIINGPTDIFYQ